MSKHSRRQAAIAAARLHTEHKHIVEFVILVSAELFIKLTTDPDGMKHGVARFLAMLGF